MPSWKSTISGPSPATSAYSPTLAASGRDELAALRADPVEQLRERVGELLHALAVESLDHVVVVDARLRDLVEDAVRLVDVPLQGRRDLAVVLEGLDRLLRHGVHRLRADQLLDVDDVAVVGVLRRRGRPEAALFPRALRLESLPARAGVELLVALVGELRVGDRELALQLCGRAGLIEPPVGLGVDAR